MSPRVNLLRTTLIGLLLPAFGGCPEVAQFLPGLTTVDVEVINDTSFPVDPNLRFDNDSGFLASLFPADTLDTGLIEPGETASYRFDCEELGLIISDEAEQVISFFNVYVADPTGTLERDDEYDCGDLVRFRFVGDGQDFGVIVSVNGRIVD